MTRWYDIGLHGVQEGEPYFTVLKVVARYRRDAIQVARRQAISQGLTITHIEWARGHRTKQVIPFGHFSWSGIFHFYPKENSQVLSQAVRANAESAKFEAAMGAIVGSF